MYGSRPADAVLSTRRHNDLLVFEQQARIRRLAVGINRRAHYG